MCGNITEDTYSSSSLDKVPPSCPVSTSTNVGHVAPSSAVGFFTFAEVLMEQKTFCLLLVCAVYVLVTLCLWLKWLTCERRNTR